MLQVWQDGHKRSRGDPNYLTLWRPIAPAGYVSMGTLASLGGREPPSYSAVRQQHGYCPVSSWHIEPALLVVAPIVNVALVLCARACHCCTMHAPCLRVLTLPVFICCRR